MKINISKIVKDILTRTLLTGIMNILNNFLFLNIYEEIFQRDTFDAFINN